MITTWTVFYDSSHLQWTNITAIAPYSSHNCKTAIITPATIFPNFPFFLGAGACGAIGGSGALPAGGGAGESLAGAVILVVGVVGAAIPAKASGVSSPIATAGAVNGATGGVTTGSGAGLVTDATSGVITGSVEVGETGGVSGARGGKDSLFGASFTAGLVVSPLSAASTISCGLGNTGVTGS
jgi:hypothetical protein